jgi:hypothetical protein
MGSVRFREREREADNRREGEWRVRMMPSRITVAITTKTYGEAIGFTSCRSTIILALASWPAQSDTTQRFMSVSWFTLVLALALALALVALARQHTFLSQLCMLCLYRLEMSQQCWKVDTCLCQAPKVILLTANDHCGNAKQIHNQSINDMEQYTCDAERNNHLRHTLWESIATCPMSIHCSGVCVVFQRQSLEAGASTSHTGS